MCCVAFCVGLPYNVMSCRVSSCLARVNCLQEKVDMMKWHIDNGKWTSEASSIELKNATNGLSEQLKHANLYISDYNFRDFRKGK